MFAIFILVSDLDSGSAIVSGLDTKGLWSGKCTGDIYEGKLAGQIV